MSKFKKKKNPIEHEERYIEFLEKQIAWLSCQDNIDAFNKAKELKYKLSKARLILKVLTS